LSTRVVFLERLGKTINKSTRGRLLIVLATGLLLTLIEMIDHYEPDNPSFFKPDFWHRLPIYAVLLPLFTWILLELLHRSETARMETKQEMALQSVLSQTLLTCTQFDDLVEAIVLYPGEIVPAHFTTLHILTEPSATFKLIGSWRSPDYLYADITSLPSPDNCLSCNPMACYKNGGFSQCSNISNQIPSTYTYYCAPLLIQDRLLGLLSFIVPDGYSITVDQQKALDWVLPDITVALTRAMYHRSPSKQRDSTLTESRQIAQDLHDTLAQNIGYLRLKLDQLVLNDPIGGDNGHQNDFLQMRDAANEAYEQIRGTLATLNKLEQGELVNQIRERARLIQERAGFEVRVVTVGRSLPLNTDTKRHILYISREALNNVEKHARAHTAIVRLIWKENELLVEIEDDGLGFDPAVVQTENHLGLSIMGQRAQVLRGKLTISSAIGNGSLVTLQVPMS